MLARMSNVLSLWLLCLGHGLHNLVNVDAIQTVPEIKMLTTQCKKIVKELRYRLPELEEEAEREQRNVLWSLEKTGEELENDENEPILINDESNDDSDSDVETEFVSKHIPSIKTSTPTRWHSILAMLESLNHACNRHAVNVLLGQISKEELKLNQFDWKLLIDVLTFLKKSKDAVDILSAQKTTSLNVALVFRFEIKDSLQTLTHDESLIMLTLKRNMMRKLDHRFPVTKLLVAATLLDCRFQGIREVDEYLETENETRVSFLSNYVKEIVKTPPSVETQNEVGVATPSSSTSINTLLIKLSTKHSVAEALDEDPVTQECWKYFSTVTPQNLSDGDLLKNWLERKCVFPWLAAVARSILATPATSTPSERVFSTSGLVLSAKRSRLTGTRLNKIIFVHDNYHTCKNNAS